MSRGDTYSSETHSKLRRSAAVGYPLTLSWFRKAGPTTILYIIGDASVPLRGTIFRWRCRTYPQLRCFAACSGFHDIGPASRNQQLILNLLAFVGAWLRRDAIASWVCPASSYTARKPHNSDCLIVRSYAATLYYSPFLFTCLSIPFNGSMNLAIVHIARYSNSM